MGGGKKIKRGIQALLLAGAAACGQEKDIALDLGLHSPQLVVECYLEPGRPYRLTLTESTAYFDAPEPPQVPEALVVISHQGRRDTLRYLPTVDTIQKKLYTHFSPTLVSGKPGAVYTLEISDKQGRKITGSTTLMAPVPIDSLIYRFNDRQKAYIEARFQDPGATADHYFFSVHLDSTNRKAEVNYQVPDQLNNGKPFALGTGFDFEPYDSVIVSLFHLEEPYYEFLNSTEEARNANSNPFAQPSRLRSTVQGGLGVFTNLAVVRQGKRLLP
ncbi:MAG: DUF4249 domain-containing protein [Adhaeribacter sp.]